MPPLDYIPVRADIVRTDKIRTDEAVEGNDDPILNIPERLETPERPGAPDPAHARVRLVRLRTDTTPNNNMVLAMLLDELRLRLWAGLEAGAFRLD
jgi:hypothetical protein